jgi:probable phosphoglycerate mutase
MTDVLHWQPPRRRRIYLVRHGDVTYFDESGRPFRPDTVPLNDDGRAQAAVLARELANLPIDRVVSSDLPRCTETAAIFMAGRNLRVETFAELREIRPGRLSELPPEETIQAFVGAFSGFDRTAKFLGGETFGELADRVLPCFQHLLMDGHWQTLLVVAHGGVNRVLLAYAIGHDMLGFGAFEQDPCCLNIIDVTEDGRFLIRLVNETPYDLAKTNLSLTTMERLYDQYRALR